MKMSLAVDGVLAERISRDIREKGYAIGKNMLASQQVASLRDYGFGLLSRDVTEDVVWDPYIGERDKLCYSDDAFQCLYRGYVFPWNFHGTGDQFDIFNSLNSFRLEVAKSLSLDENLQINDIYTTWSYYPSGKGWLKAHRDTLTEDSLLLHYIIPLTFKGVDFEEGGLFITDKRGDVVDVDSEMCAGDVLFFDGSCLHEVRKVVSKNDVGRMQAFAIPTVFQYPDQSERFLKRLSLYKVAQIKSKDFLHKVKSRIRSI